MIRVPGARGPLGATGPNGPQGSQGPCGSNTLYTFSTDQSVGNNDYITQGSSSSAFLRNTIVLGADTTFTSIVFNRRVANTDNSVATLWYQRGGGAATATALAATVPGDNTSWYAGAFGSVSLLMGDLITIRVTGLSGAYSNGVTIAIQ